MLKKDIAIAYLLPMLRSVLFLGLTIIAALLFKQTFSDLEAYWTSICVIANLMTIGVLVLLFKRDGTSYFAWIKEQRENVSKKELILIPLGMLIYGMIGLIGFGLIILGGMPSFLVQSGNLPLAIINIVLLPTTIVLAEIPLYFGYAFPKINQHSKSKVFALCYVIVFYALQHVFIPVNFDVEIMIFRFVSFLPLLGFLGFLTSEKKSIFPMITIFGYN